jgi:hypothetical protein
MPSCRLARSASNEWPTHEAHLQAPTGARGGRRACVRTEERVGARA